MAGWENQQSEKSTESLLNIYDVKNSARINGSDGMAGSVFLVNYEVSNSTG